MTKNMKLLLIGGIGMAAGTALSIAVDRPRPVAGTAMMLILAMSAALCGAAVPGVIRFDSKAIRATGAVVFFIVPWIVPAAPLGSSGEEAKSPNADPSSPDPGSKSDSGATPPTAGTKPPNPGTRPPIRIPAPVAAKPAEKRATFSRPRTIFDGLFTSQSSPDAAKAK